MDDLITIENFVKSLGEFLLTNSLSNDKDALIVKLQFELNKIKNDQLLLEVRLNDAEKKNAILQSDKDTEIKAIKSKNLIVSSLCACGGFAIGGIKK